MKDAVDDLAGALFALETAGLCTAAVTAQITSAVIRWAIGSGWVVRTEARVRPDSWTPANPRSGYIDVIVRRGADTPDLAIEIDSADKPWSVEKLRHAAAAGMHAIWVRWGDDEWAGVFDDVDVIQLRVLRHPATRFHSPQLTFW